MNRKILLHNQEVEYKLRKSRRARRMRIAVYGDAGVVVTLPAGIKEGLAAKFLSAKAGWLLDKISYFKKNGKLILTKGGKKNYQKNKQAALKLAVERVNYFNRIYQLEFNKITVKRQKTRWGSCSKKGNLNFNYKILFLPAAAADYIVVHELCHLKEFNHSKKFWNLVAAAAPDYLKLRKELRRRQ